MAPRPRPAEFEPSTQTTVRFPRAMLKRARLRAINDEVTFQSLVVAAVEAELDRRDREDARQEARRARHVRAAE